MGQGRDAAKQFLKDHPEVAKDIEKKIKEKTGLLPAPSVPGEAKGKPEVKTEAKSEPKKETAFVPTEKAKEAERAKVALKK
jgi:recombination protein RecA